MGPGATKSSSEREPETTHVRGCGGQPPQQEERLAPRTRSISLAADAEQEQQNDQDKWRAEQPEQDQDHLRLLLYIRVVRSDVTRVRSKPAPRVR